MNSTETNYTNIQKICRSSDGHALIFWGLCKGLLKSQWINSNSCTQELVSQGLYDRYTVWHSQKQNLSKDKKGDKCHSTWLWDCGLFIDEKCSKLRNDVKLNEVM